MSTNISDVFDTINNSLSAYKTFKIEGEIITIKLSDKNAWLNVKITSQTNTQITMVYWKIGNIYNSIKIGDKYTFVGDFCIMKKNFNIYFTIKNMEKVGKGDYLETFEINKLKIRELNLSKKTINKFPQIIGIVTAIEGAAIEDIKQSFRNDNFIGQIIIKNTIVQGATCPNSIIESINWFENTFRNIDLLLITRGGGSFEDLVGFSNWSVLMKIIQTPFITISAVGHQIDNQLSDFVADYNLPTPSLGAKLITDIQNEYMEKIKRLKNNIAQIKHKYNRSKETFEVVKKNYNYTIRKFDMQKMTKNIIGVKNNLHKIISKYNSVKSNLRNKLLFHKPTIVRVKNKEEDKNDEDKNDEELLSVYDFIKVKKSGITKHKKPKKIEIFFVDGNITLSYKILEYNIQH